MKNFNKHITIKYDNYKQVYLLYSVHQVDAFNTFTDKHTSFLEAGIPPFKLDSKCDIWLPLIRVCQLDQVYHI